MALSLDTTIGAGGIIIAEGNVTTATTASFSTAANVRLVALVAANAGNTSPANLVSVSGAGLSWTGEVLNNEPSGSPPSPGGVEGSAVIYIAYSASALSGVTVAATQTGDTAGGMALTVVGVLGAEVTHGGAENVAESTSGTPSCAVTTTRDGSYVFSTASDWAQAGDMNVAGSSPAQTLLNTYNLAGQVSCGQARSTNTVSIGTQTMDFTVAGRKYRMAVIEIREVAGAGAAAQNLPAYDPVPFIPRGRSM